MSGILSELVIAFIAGLVPVAYGFLDALLEINPSTRSWIEQFQKSRWGKALLRLSGQELPKRQVSIGSKLKKLSTQVSKISEESDLLVGELSRELSTRKQILNRLGREQRALNKQIERIKKDPTYATIQLNKRMGEILAAQHVESRNSTRRDYFLYLLGVITPLIISWLLRVFEISFP